MLDGSFVTHRIDFTINFVYHDVVIFANPRQVSYSSFVSAARARFEYRSRISTSSRICYEVAEPYLDLVCLALSIAAPSFSGLARMPSRRSHEKSHHGCVTCKRRRVKVRLSYSVGSATIPADRSSVMRVARNVRIAQGEEPNVPICRVTFRQLPLAPTPAAYRHPKTCQTHI